MGKVEIAALIILAIIVLLFGAKKLPELARGLGRSARELKDGFKESAETIKEETRK
jgi:sec-independent protein translocase protein TatA